AVEVVDAIALRAAERDQHAARVLAVADDLTAQRHRPALHVEVDPHARTRRDPIRRRHEDRPVARVEDLEPLGVAGKPKLEPYRPHHAIVNQSRYWITTWSVTGLPARTTCALIAFAVAARTYRFAASSSERSRTPSIAVTTSPVRTPAR